LSVDAGRPARHRGPYESRPGRQAVVVADLADLHGPVSGTVELPLRLFWHPDRVFDLGDQDMLLWMYENVLREAISTDELTAYLNSKRLVAVWPHLELPKGVRRAWEECHPVLAAAAASAI
jgi:hypothetical protein